MMTENSNTERLGGARLLKVRDDLVLNIDCISAITLVRKSEINGWRKAVDRLYKAPALQEMGYLVEQDGAGHGRLVTRRDGREDPLFFLPPERYDEPLCYIVHMTASEDKYCLTPAQYAGLAQFAEIDSV